MASPFATARTLAELFGRVQFWKICLRSLWRIACGFLLGVLSGTVCGVCSRFRVFDALISPLMTVIRCVPVASFIILTWYFLSRNQVPVFTAFLMVMPIVWGNVKAGFATVDPALREVAQVYHMPFAVRARHLYLPAVLPYFAAGCSAALGLSWKAGVAAEVLCRPALSIGNEIFLSKSYLETPLLFAWTAVVVLLSLILERLMRFVTERIGGKGAAR